MKHRSILNFMSRCRSNTYWRWHKKINCNWLRVYIKWSCCCWMDVLYMVSIYRFVKLLHSTVCRSLCALPFCKNIRVLPFCKSLQALSYCGSLCALPLHLYLWDMFIYVWDMQYKLRINFIYGHFGNALLILHLLTEFIWLTIQFIFLFRYW